MIYLTETEVNSYTDIPGVTTKHITIASALIDTYIGKNISQYTYTETIALNKKGKGKLKNLPINSISEAKAIYRNPFGVTEEIISLSALSYDDFGYVSFYGSGINSMIFGSVTNQLKITYSAGLSVIPEDLKIACGSLAGNIKKRGGLDNVKEWSDLDTRVTLTNASVFSEDIRMLCNRYRGV